MSDAESMIRKYNAKGARWPSLAQPWTIHRVPHSIRAVDKDAYEPKMLSIGPYHRSKPNLQAMEDHKWRYVQAILIRNPERELSHYLEEMKRLEVEVRSFYSEKIEMWSEEFVEMMLLDGCFIVALFLNLSGGSATAETDDPIYSTKWILPIILLDMLLLENQLPFLVVKRIFQLVNGTSTSSSIVFALRFFKRLMPMKKRIPSANSIPPSMESIHHLLHLYHMHLIPTPPQGGNTSVAISQDNRPMPPPRSFMSASDQGGNISLDMNPDIRTVWPPRSIIPASDLRDYLRLTKKKKASSILDVNLEGECLEIPTLRINHSTNSVYRNLIAWEQCYPNCGTQVTSYAFFMGCLMDSPQDVAILTELNIIEHWLGNNEEVALLFKQMCIGITYDSEDNFLSDLFKKVDDIKRKLWQKWRQKWRRPETWSLLNIYIAIWTFYLAIAQTAIALFPVNKKNS